MKEDQDKFIQDSLQKLQYSKSLMPMNNTLDKIIKKKSLEFADLSAAEMQEVMREDETTPPPMPPQIDANGQPVQGQPQVGGQPAGQPAPMPVTM